MSATNITDDDEGKPVMSSNGEQIGTVKEVRGGTAHVDPDPDMFDNIKSKLGWGDAGEDTYPLDANDIAEVTDDEVRLT